MPKTGQKIYPVHKDSDLRPEKYSCLALEFFAQDSLSNPNYHETHKFLPSPLLLVNSHFANFVPCYQSINSYFVATPFSIVPNNSKNGSSK